MDVIPVFQFWFGKRPEGVLRLEKTVEATYTKERGFDYHRLTEKDIPVYIRNLVKTCRKENVTDLIRYWLLYTYGGVWFDSDMVSRKPIDFHGILNSGKNLVISANVRRTRWCSPCILASLPENFLIEKMRNTAYSRLKTRGRRLNYEAVGPKLAFNVLNYYKGKWIMLPKIGIVHQARLNGMPPWKRYSELYSEKYHKMVYGIDWYYAHFCGNNVRRFVKNPERDTVLKRTVLRAEKDLGINGDI